MNVYQIVKMLESEKANRDATWVHDFLTYIPELPMKTATPQTLKGPDHFHYFVLETPAVGEQYSGTLISKVLDYCLANALGIVINPAKGNPDWVFSFGDLWQFHTAQSFLREKPTKPAGREVIQEEKQVMIGQPNENIFPKFARDALKIEFSFWKGLKEKTPMVFMMSDPKEVPAHHLCFNISQEDFENDVKQYESCMRRFSWYLPGNPGLIAFPGSNKFDDHFETF